MQKAVTYIFKRGFISEIMMVDANTNQTDRL